MSLEVGRIIELLAALRTDVHNLFLPAPVVMEMFPKGHCVRGIKLFAANVTLELVVLFIQILIMDFAV